MQKNNIITISDTDKRYPKELKQLHKPPKQLHVQGASVNDLLKRPAVAVVGSRKVSGYGQQVTKDLTKALAKNNVLIISGLALGVDSLAHEEAVKAGGKTLSVLPSGIDKIYPARHSRLAEKIVGSGGTLISEYPNKQSPMRHNFIERNRIIAALCDVLLITEAAERSGSLHTARFALEMGKTVAAVPGDIYSPTSAGCNNLIKTGAQPVTSAADVIECLNFSGQQLSFAEGYYPENKAEEAVIRALRGRINDGDELESRSKLSPAEFRKTLSILEVKGVVIAGGNNRWRLK